MRLTRGHGVVHRCWCRADVNLRDDRELGAHARALVHQLVPPPPTEHFRNRAFPQHPGASHGGVMLAGGEEQQSAG